MMNKIILFVELYIQKLEFFILENKCIMNHGIRRASLIFYKT